MIMQQMNEGFGMGHLLQFYFLQVSRARLSVWPVWTYRVAVLPVTHSSAFHGPL